MNELIHEFAIYSDFGPPVEQEPRIWTEWVAEDEDIERFARLVALDCIKIIEQEVPEIDIVINKIKERYEIK
jgi:hypothetical protein